MTFLLVMTVYAAAVVKPGHGNTAPLAIGLALYAAALTGELVASGKSGEMLPCTLGQPMADCRTDQNQLNGKFDQSQQKSCFMYCSI